jgi:hypothetical protein
MTRPRLLLALAIIASGCVSSRTINDLTLVPLSPIDAQSLVWRRPSIQWVNPFSPAGAAGLQAGDVLITWDHLPLPDIGAAQRLLWAPRAQDSIEVTYSRGGEQRIAVLRGVAGGKPVGCDVYPLDSTYSLSGFPGLASDVGFLQFGSAELSVYAAHFSDRPEILLLRLQVDNTRGGLMDGPAAVQVMDPRGSIYHQLSAAGAVGHLLPQLGSQSPYAPYVPYKPPVYRVSADGRYLYPENDPYTAAANAITAIGNMITSVNNARRARREADREALYNQLEAAQLQQHAIPAGGRDGGVLLFMGSASRPVRVMVSIENRWHTLVFQ